jgi:hypothetical protein
LSQLIVAAGLETSCQSADEMQQLVRALIAVADGE